MPYKNPKQQNEYMRKHMQARYQRRRAEAIQLLGGACVHCGTQDSLEFDHIRRREKRSSIADLLCRSKQLLLKELEKCQLLCSKCHFEKTQREGRFRNEEDSFDISFP